MTEWIKQKLEEKESQTQAGTYEHAEDVILTDILGGKKKRKSFEKSFAGQVSRPKKRSSVAGSKDDASRKCLDGKRDFKDFRFQLYLIFLEWVDPTKRDVQINLIVRPV